MKKIVIISIVVLCLASTWGCAKHKRPETQAESVPEYPALANIKTIYIDNLGNEQSAAFVTEKIRLGLMKSARLVVLESVDKADAVLTGVAGVEKTVRGGSDYEGTGSISIHSVLTGYAVLRLVSVKTSETIWSFEDIKRCRWSAPSCIADTAVKKLLADTSRADEKFKNVFPLADRQSLMQ